VVPTQEQAQGSGQSAFILVRGDLDDLRGAT
jgi:hypothetical protein